jgi:hypothetical protein
LFCRTHLPNVFWRYSAPFAKVEFDFFLVPRDPRLALFFRFFARHPHHPRLITDWYFFFAVASNKKWVIKRELWDRLVAKKMPSLPNLGKGFITKLDQSVFRYVVSHTSPVAISVIASVKSQI